jgi:hypothetical protein
MLFPRWRRCGASPAMPWPGAAACRPACRWAHRQPGAGRQHCHAHPLRRAAAAQSELYFRGPVLSTFDGREWRRAAGSRFARDCRMATCRSRPAGALPGHAGAQQPPLAAGAGRHAAQPASARARHAHDRRPAVASRPPVTDLLRYRAQSHLSFATARCSAPPPAAGFPASCRRASTRARCAGAANCAADPRAGAGSPAPGAARCWSAAHRRLQLHAGARRVRPAHGRRVLV